MEKRINSLEATSAALETEITYAKSEKAVEEWARTYERMAQEGDKVIVPLPPMNVTPEVNLLPTPEVEDHQNWEIWWELIFGE